MGAAACLIKYLDLLADEGLHGKLKLRELVLYTHNINTSSWQK
jgi:hypothetical protein